MWRPGFSFRGTKIRRSLSELSAPRHKLKRVCRGLGGSTFFCLFFFLNYFCVCFGSTIGSAQRFFLALQPEITPGWPGDFMGCQGSTWFCCVQGKYPPAVLLLQPLCWVLTWKPGSSWQAQSPCCSGMGAQPPTLGRVFLEQARR